MRFAACHIHCFANHNGSNAQNRRGPSGDHTRRSPFWRLWVLRLPLQRARGPAATTRAAGPSAVSGHCIALQIPMAVTHRTAGGPAATTRAAVPSGGSGSCACHCRERGADRRPTRAAGPSAVSGHCIALQIPMAITHRTAGGPAATTRAAVPSGGSGYCACHCKERGAQRRPRAPQALLEALGTAPATAESEGPSGDHARRRPFCSL